ncbi:hypothetical protein GCM10008908_07900 [Clostridium subterminale]|uniref:Glycosyltransferase 2-like domain-containing protein n=1 Tax=Clostridium subterminale TaxID=1550 RepID=A0ABP3VX17_CLOSU
MNNKPLVSVIIPFYNRVDWLMQAIDSVLNQTYTNYEILIINDGSKENMDDFLLRYKEKIIYIVKENGGPAAARNLGIKKARGEYIAFLDSDDLWISNKLEYQINEMINKNAAWSQTSYELFGDGADGKKVNAIINPNLFKKMLYISNGIATPTVIIKKRILEGEDTYFKEYKRYGEDIDLWIRLSKKSDILSIDKYLTKVRIRGKNAGLLASVQLQSRAEFCEDIKLMEEVNGGIKLNYKICKMMYQILCDIKHRITDNQIIFEACSKILYFVPYVIFKLYKIYMLNIKWK